MKYKILLTFTLVSSISYTQASESSTSLEKRASTDFSHTDNERLFNAIEAFGTYKHPSDSKTLVQNILENKTLKNDERGYDEISDFSGKKIGTLIMKDHPIVQFILNRVSIPSITLAGHTSYVESALFNSNGDKALTYSHDGRVKIWNALTGNCLVTTAYSGSVYSAVFNGSEDMILTASSDNTAKIWNALIGNCLVTTAYSCICSAVFNSTEDKILTASYVDTAQIWNAQTGDCLVTFKGHTKWVNSAIFSRSGDKVLTASGDNTAKIWNAHTGKCLVTLEGHTDQVKSAVFNGSEDKVLTASEDKTAKIWDTHTGKCLITFKGHRGVVRSAVFTSNEDRVLTASWDHTAKIWDVHTGNCLVTLTGHDSTVDSAIFNKAEDRVLTASTDCTAKIWDAQTGQCIITLEGHKRARASVNSAVFNRSGDKVLTASNDRTAMIWNVRILQFFSQKVTLKQAFVLNEIGEVIICREWVQKYPEKFYVVNKDGQKITNVPISQVIENMRFDFNKYPHLQKGEKGYEGFPQEIQIILDPYVKKTDQAREASTSSTASIKTG